MTTALLQHEEFGELRMQEVDGEPWFVAKDVCGALGISNHKDATASLDETEAGVVSTDLRSKNGVVQKRELLHVNESGLYQLIFQSRKAKAKEFTRWVTSEVLPSIRKTGVYAKPPHDTESNFARPAVTQMIAHVHHCLFLLASDTAEIRTRELRSRMLATIHSAYDVLNYKFLKINPKEINR